MDAATVLDNTAAAYSALRTLAAELRAVTESGDEGMAHRSEARIRVRYAAPDRVRIEQPGPNGVIEISDGIHRHHYAAPMKRYAKMPVDPGVPLPGFFRPEFPGGGTDFLFPRIGERVLEARILDSPGLAIEVQYETFESAGAHVGPVRFEVDPDTWLIRRRTCAMTFQDPHGGRHGHVLTIEFVHAVINEPIEADVFEFAPPPDAIDMSRPGRQGGFAAGGGSRSRSGPMPGGGTFEQRSSHHWEGETFVERETVRMRGAEAAFERRFTLEPEGHLTIREKIRGPKGELTRELALPLD